MPHAKVARVALTPGEPAGIGPELSVQLAQRAHTAEIVVIADRDMLSSRAARLGVPLEIEAFHPERTPRALPAGHLMVMHQPLVRASHPGQLDPMNAAGVLKALEIACDGCLEGRFDALVTGPIHKAAINEAGVPFTGHTEFLARRCHAHPLMMLTAPGLRVALATTHLPLSAVSRHLTVSRLQRVIGTLDAALRSHFGIRRPRILVCGLNPHAGEGGHLGREEIEVIRPALDGLRAMGLLLEGPLPADTLFTPPFLRRADAVLAMYHDQGLPVLKHLGFGRAVNVTLGLPIIRTSVDHGTALELAGTGKAQTGSLDAALEMAVTMASHRPVSNNPH